MFGFDVQEAINGRGDIARAVGACRGIGSLAVGRADDLADAGASSREEDRTGRAPVVSAAVLVDFRCPAKLGQEHDQRVVEQSAAFKIVDHPGKRPVDAGHVVRPLRHVANVREVLGGHVVVVPQIAVQAVIAIVDHHEPRPGFNQSGGHQAAAADFGATVGRAIGF